jgi:Na+/proline symporter
VKRENQAVIGLGAIILAIFILPNPYGTWLVALVVIAGAILGGMDMVNSNNWRDGLVVAVIVTVGLLLMVFIGSGGGGGGEVP